MAEAAAPVFARPQTGTFTIALYRQVLDQVLEGKVFTLTVSTGENERVFFFTRGAILFLAVGSSGGEILARRIEARSLLPKERLDPLIAKANTDTPLLQDLLKDGILDHMVVTELVENLIEEHLIEVSLWDGLALYDLVPGNPPTRLYEPEVPALRLSVGTKPILERTRKKLDGESQKYLAALGGSLRNKVRANEGTKGSGNVERRVLAALEEGARPIVEVVIAAQLAGVAPFEAASALARFVLAGEATIERVTALAPAEELAQAAKVEDAFEQFVNRLLARAHLAAIYERASEKEKAAEQYRGIAEEHLRRDGIVDALVALRNVVRILPTDVAGRELLVKVLRGANRIADAAKEAIDLGRLLLELRLPGRARHAFDLALKLVPKNLGVLRMLAGLLRFLGEKEQAIVRYEEIAALSQEAGDVPGVVAAYQEVLDLDPANARARRIVHGLTGYRRAVLARWATGGAAVLILLLTLAWGTYELFALSAYREARRRAIEALDEQKFDVARSVVNELLRGWTFSRMTRAADSLLREIDQEERVVREQRCLKDERAAAKLEAAGAVPEALERWKSASSSEDPSRRAAAQAGTLRCEQRMKTTTEALESARRLEEQNLPHQAYELIARTVKESPWLLNSAEVRLPCLIESLPMGAQVAIDGTIQGQPTPVVVKRLLAAGKLRLEGRGREPLELELSPVPPWPFVGVLPRRPLFREREVVASGEPLVQGDMVVVAGTDRFCTALGRERGERRWRVALGILGECDSAPVPLEGSLLAVRARSGIVFGLERASGVQVFATDLAAPPFDPLDPSPGRLVAAGGGVLLREGARGLVLLGKDGAPRWRAEARSEIVGSPSVAGDLVVVAHERAIAAWKWKTGEPAWTTVLPEPAVTGPVEGPRGIVFLGLESGALARFQNDGRAFPLLKDVVDSGIAAPLEGSAVRVLVGSRTGEIVGVDEQGKKVLRASLDQGKPVRWIKNVPEGILAGDQGSLFVLDAKGQELWRTPQEGGSPAQADGYRIYQGAAQGFSVFER